MCSACATTPVDLTQGAPGPTQPRRFAALRCRDSRPYLFGAGLAMMADNIEHVITYWVLWREFHSPALAGFEVISHWLPFLLLSVWFGSLADRHDCRRLIQGAQALFIAVSVAWGVLFWTDSVTLWAACVLLVLHGCAGALWGPAEQMMLQDFAAPVDLPSAVRMNATFRSLGILFGPVVGSLLLLGLGPVAGILVNAAIYLPLTLFLLRTPYTGHVRTGIVTRARVGVLGSVRVLRQVSADRVLVGMIVLAGLGSFFLGASLQSSMPIFADDLGAGDAAFAYGVLLFAAGAGGVLGGFFLEATRLVPPRVAAAVASLVLYGLSVLVFATTSSYPLAVVVLALGGVANLAAMSITQTVVQLRAEPEVRGQVLGLYGMSSGGLRVGSGFTVGLAGAALGIHASLAASAAALAVGALVVGWLVRPAAGPSAVDGAQAEVTLQR